MILAICATRALAIDFSASKWIWTNEINSAGNTVPGSRAFRRDFYSPEGKQALSANILLTVDNAYTFYVNGAKVGAGTDWTKAQAYCVRLKPDCNVFAINGTNYNVATPGGLNPAGVLAAIQIRYTDGFTQNIVSDSSWHVSKTVPAGFEQLRFDDSSWPAATVQANYGAAPWRNIQIPPSASSTPLTLQDADRIWTNEIVNGAAPIGARAFRKTIILPPGQTSSSATILIGVDDAFTLYAQGKVVGSGTTPNWPNAHRWVVDYPPTSELVIAIQGSNAGGPASITAAIDLSMDDCDCGSTLSVVTDGTWKYNKALPAGFQSPGFDDSKWPAAVVVAKYGTGPYRNFTIPAEAIVVNLN